MRYCRNCFLKNLDLISYSGSLNSFFSSKILYWPLNQLRASWDIALRFESLVTNHVRRVRSASIHSLLSLKFTEYMGCDNCLKSSRYHASGIEDPIATTQSIDRALARIYSQTSRQGSTCARM